jgi:LysR family nitrogen assimilation transcriptional regulator
MDFKEVRYFLQVARAGSFNRAAHELNIAQPALSRQVRKLETSLGVDLFVRHGRGVRLTSAGSLLYEGAESIHHMVKRTTERIRAGGENLAGHVTFGVPPAAGLLIAGQRSKASARSGHTSPCTCGKASRVHCRNGCSTGASTSA